MPAAQVQGQSARAPSTGELLSGVAQAMADNAARIQTLMAQGRIRHQKYFRDVEAPHVTLDAELWLTYQAPKFRLHLQYAPTGPGGDAPAARATLEQQTVLFDGQTVTTVEQRPDGEWRGDIYFEFHKQNMLRMAGFPFADPVTLWNEPLPVGRADLLASKTTPLLGGGFVGVLDKDTYRLKYYFLGDFPFDLRRVSSYRADEELPFRDWHLQWRQAHGIHYVERLVRRVNESPPADGDLSASGVSHEQIDLQFPKVVLNPAISPAACELSALALPEETPFYDHRVNINGKPKLLRWRGGQLVPHTP